MGRVKFHDICDQCGKHSAEYEPWYICTDCLETVCDTCAPEGDGETLRSNCKRCINEAIAATSTTATPK